jgi:Ycf66 protein N-terminus
MVNFGLNSASILGIFLAVAGASLYFLRSIRPELSRDQDIFFAAVGLLCGFILLFQGWRLDPILQFGQFLLTGSTIFFAVETIRLRGIATEQARRNTPIVERDRPVAQAWTYEQEAELDRLEPYDEDRYEEPRLRPYQDSSRPSRRSSSRVDRDESSRSNKRSSYDKYNPREAKDNDREAGTDSNRPRRSRPSNSSSTAWTESTGEADRYGSNSREETPDAWGEEPSYPTRRSRSRPENRSSEDTSKPTKRRRRPVNQERPSYTESEPSPYVDYQPIEEDRDNRDEERDTPKDINIKPKPQRDRDRDNDNPINFDY